LLVFFITDKAHAPFVGVDLEKGGGAGGGGGGQKWWWRGRFFEWGILL